MDLTKIGAILNLRTLKPFIVWTVVGLLYYLAAKLVAWAGWKLERRLSRHSAWRGL
jgi:polar amino acid transport system permease protein